MPWHLSNNHAGCSGWAVVKDDTDEVVGCHKSKAQALSHMAALYANEPEASMAEQVDSEAHQDAEPFLYHYEDGLIEVRTPFEDWEIRHSGRRDESFTVRGYAAVFDQLSLDLGGFNEKIDRHAFDAVLQSNPDVHFVWDHDTRYVGARTRNGTLGLRTDPHGLFMDAQIGNYSWAKDLRTALERGDINQGSFKFAVGDDDWDHDGNGNITRTIRSVSGLYDVTVTAQGAYPQTSVSVARSLIEAARAEGRLPEEAEAALVAEGGEEEPSQPGGEEKANPAVNPAVEELLHLLAVRKDELAKLKERTEKL